MEETNEPVDLSPKLNNIKLLANDLLAHTHEKDALEEKLTKVKALIKETSDKLIPLMNAEEMSSFKTPLGVTFYINTATRATVKDPDVAFPYLKSIGLDGLIKLTVNSTSLSSDIKKLISDGSVLLQELEPQGISVYIDESVRIRGKNSAKTY